MIKRTHNISNVKKVNRCVSIVNIVECVIDDIETEKNFMIKSFNFTINYLLDVFHIKFSDVRNIVKYFNLKRYDVVISLLNNIIKRCKNYIKSYYM